MFKIIGNIFGAIVLVATLGFASGAQALQFDQDVTSNVIFGSGNANGAFTTDTQNGIELGLRAKVRFNDSNLPENTFNSGGDGNYTFQTGVPSPGFGFAPNNPKTAKWNFEWSINSNVNGTGGDLDDFIYVLQIDGNPAAGVVDFGAGGFDLINTSFADHAIGDNLTANGAGTSLSPTGPGVPATVLPADEANYAALIANNNLAQNSANFLFFTGLSQLASFNPGVLAEYTITLSAFNRDIGNGSQLLASTSINVSAVPLPAALPLFGTGLAVMGFVGWRRRKVVTA